MSSVPAKPGHGLRTAHAIAPKTAIHINDRYEVTVVRDESGAMGFRIADPPLAVSELDEDRREALHPMDTHIFLTYFKLDFGTCHFHKWY